ncbi:MAG TPA: hypothetical protein VF953_10330 [Terriglobales bacterium]|jgi:Skp family chaperone for outer membrane proteins
MSTQAVSSVSIFQELQSFYQDRRTDVRQLGSALQSGDLSKAQQAFGTLVALGQSGPFGNAEPFSSTSRAQTFEAIGQALQSGDLAGAQAAFASLQQTQGNANNHAQQLPAFIVNIRATQNSADTDAASAESIFQQRQDFREQRKTDIQQLGQALQAGNADAAQQAYDALTALGQNGPFRNSDPFQRTDRAQDFAAIGQALQSGDLAGAKQAFTDLANTFGHHNQLPPGPPTYVPPPITLPPIGTLFLGPPTPVPPPNTLPPISTLPPHTLPPGPPTLLPPTTLPPHTQPPLTSGGRPSGGITNYQLVANLFDNGSNSSASGSSLSLQA